MFLTGVTETFTASHRDPVMDEGLHSHTWTVTAWYPAEPLRDGRALKSALATILVTLPAVLPQELWSGESLAKHVWHDATTLFCWRKEKHRRDGQVGVNCVVFRNEGRELSSSLIVLADAIADVRWPGERHFTFVEAAKTQRRRGKASRPGACFIHAGWRECGVTAKGLIILETEPSHG